MKSDDEDALEQRDDVGMLVRDLHLEEEYRCGNYEHADAAVAEYWCRMASPWCRLCQAEKGEESCESFPVYINLL